MPWIDPCGDCERWMSRPRCRQTPFPSGYAGARTQPRSNPYCVTASCSGARRSPDLTQTSARDPRKRLAWAIAGLTALIVVGSAGYMTLEHYRALDAVFMTVITVSTVGYGEVHPLDAAGQIFTITLIILGVIAFLYTFGVLVEILSSGDLQRLRRGRQMDARLSALRDHVIVCGYGRTGRQVVLELRQSAQPYVIIEMNPEPLAEVVRDEEVYVVGDAASDQVLERAGIARARALVSAVDSDERNVFIVLSARALAPDLAIVARSAQPDTFDKLRRAGADRVVSPYALSGTRMAALAMQPAVVDAIDMVLTGESVPIRMEELVVPEWAGTSVTAATLRQSGAVLLAVRKPDGRLLVGPGDAEPMTAHDIVVAMGTREQLHTLASELRPHSGGSR